MSARGGARAKGTDGSDFGNREKVASHYEISSSNKRRLKISLFLHIVLFFMMTLKVVPDLLKLLDMRMKIFDSLMLPKSELWEKIWIASILCILPAYYALRKNNITSIKVFMLSMFLCGICPLMIGIMYNSSDLKTFLMSKDFAIGQLETVHGIPHVFIIYGFILIAFITQSLSIMFSMTLMQAWAPKKKGKKKA